MTITEPGVYQLDADTYHADPVEGGSLSSSGARAILHSPARFAWDLEHGTPDKPVFDLGKAAHRLILGDGSEIVEVEAENWRTKAAQDQRDDAHEAGQTPLLTKDLEIVKAMATAIQQHPVAKALLSAGHGKAEQALIVQDHESGVWKRALVDWLPEPTTGRRFILTDYKTARSADPARFPKAVVDYGYHQQAAWYLDCAMALGLDTDPSFVFIIQEKEPPYLVSVCELDAMAIRVGRLLNRKAINLYKECTTTKTWPGYPIEVHYISLPGWYENQQLEELYS